MKISFDSPVVLLFSVCCAVIYLISPQSVTEHFFVLLPEWDLASPSWYFRLFSHTLGHSSMDHLIGNLAFILLLGPIVEHRYGAKKIILMMISTAVITSILHLLFFNHGLLGASGIVFMMIILVSLGNFKNKTIPLSFILISLIFIGKEALSSFEDDGISHFAHICGGIAGAVFGFALSGNGTLKA